ncbi:MAG: hypothetical protein JJT89_10205 [Nitriliruptoraceae bacterium]|nr:hypothetical protein [Nitriliruptoraceae bacterium]
MSPPQPRDADRARARAIIDRQRRAWQLGDAELLFRDWAPDGELLAPGLPAIGL